MVKKHSFFSFCTLFLSFFAQSQDGVEPIVIGQQYSIPSEVLGQERPVLVYLPESYKKKERTYPVMYLLDGGGNFHHTTACVKFLAKNGRIPEMIVVGIPNTDDRTRDLTPPIVTGGGDFPTSGGADNLIRFMEKELMPWVDAKYRTENYKLLVGHSFGGLFAIHTLIHHPGIFNSYLAISPSLWWDNQNLVLEQSKAFFENQQDLAGHLFMTMGNEGNAMLGGAWKLAALLEEKSPADLHWEFELMEEETHGSIPHRSTYKGLEFIFGEWNLNNSRENLISGGIDAIQEYEASLEKLYGLSPKWEEQILSGLGQAMLDKEHGEKAVPVFKKATELFPESDQIWFQYGQSLATAGQSQEAINSLKKALELNKESLQALTSLKNLGEDVSGLLPNVKLSKKQLKGYVGKYDLEVAAVLTITSDGKQLWAEAKPHLDKEALTPLGEHRFFVLSKNSTIVFKQQDGAITALVAETPDGTIKGERKAD